VVTTIVAQVNGVNPDGNAVFGLIGLSATGSLTGNLGAGIDAKGNVFIVEQSPNIAQTIVPVGMDKGYTGGSILMKFVVDAQGVRVTAPGFDSGEVSFSKDLNNLSMNTAFPNGAVPALVAASQPNEKGGTASFQSISVITASGGVRRTGGRAHRGGRLAPV
jgi:hypothetical protein